MLHSPRETQKRRNPKSQEAESRRGDARSWRAAALSGAPPSHPCPASRTLGSVSIQDDNWRKSSFPAKNEYFPSQTPTSRETCSLGALHRFPSCPACHAHGPVPAGQSGDPAAQGFAPEGLRGGNPLKILTEVRAGKAAGFLEFLLQKAFCGICHSPESPPQWQPAPAELSHPTSPALTHVVVPPRVLVPKDTRMLQQKRPQPTPEGPGRRLCQRGSCGRRARKHLREGTRTRERAVSCPGLPAPSLAEKEAVENGSRKQNAFQMSQRRFVQGYILHSHVPSRRRLPKNQ